LKEKTDKANGLVADNDNVNIRQITTTFEKLRKMINEREETLKTQVRAIEKKNEALSSETALKPPTKIDYCIDGVDQLETKITDLLNQACVTGNCFIEVTLLKKWSIFLVFLYVISISIKLDDEFGDF
jgi:tRNA A37 threonylcarbamoyladenosine dehydratase